MTQKNADPTFRQTSQVSATTMNNSGGSSYNPNNFYTRGAQETLERIKVDITSNEVEEGILEGFVEGTLIAIIATQ